MGVDVGRGPARRAWGRASSSPSRSVESIRTPWSSGRPLTTCTSEISRMPRSGTAPRPGRRRPSPWRRGSGPLDLDVTDEGSAAVDDECCGHGDQPAHAARRRRLEPSHRAAGVLVSAGGLPRGAFFAAAFVAVDFFAAVLVAAALRGLRRGGPGAGDRLVAVAFAGAFLRPCSWWSRRTLFVAVAFCRRLLRGGPGGCGLGRGGLVAEAFLVAALAGAFFAAVAGAALVAAFFAPAAVAPATFLTAALAGAAALAAVRPRP